MALEAYSAKGLVELYNKAAEELGASPVKRFSDKETAVKRTEKILREANMTPLLEAAPPEFIGKNATAGEPEKSTKPDSLPQGTVLNADGKIQREETGVVMKKDNKKAAKPKGLTRKPSNRLSDEMRVKLVVMQNHRREGTISHSTVEILRKAGERGITIGKAIEKGAARANVAYEIKKGYAELMQ